MYIALLVRGRDRPGLLRDVAQRIAGLGGNIVFALSYAEEGRASSLFIVDFPSEPWGAEEVLLRVEGVEEVDVERGEKAYSLYAEFLERYPAMTTELVKLLDPADFLEVLIRLAPDKRAPVYMLMPPDYLARLLLRAPPELTEEACRVLPSEKLAEAASTLPPDDAVDLLQSMPPHARRAVLSRLPGGFVEKIRPLLRYPPESAGGIMTTEVVVVKQGSRVADAVELLKKSRGEVRDVLYVVDDAGRLVGYVTVPDLFKEDRDRPIESIMRRDVVSVKPTVDREEVARLMVRHDLSRVPVVDDEGRLLGVVLIEDVVDVLVAEYSEDMLLLGGIARLPRFRYLTARVSTLFYRRFLWLAVIYLIESVTATVIKGFESLIAQSAILAAFIPLLLDTGGNVGSQAATLITRALALGEVTAGDVLRIVAKEIAVALLLALAMGGMAFGFALALTSLNLRVALAVATALVTVVVTADLVGAMLPLAASLVGADPAAMSAPLITTVADVSGVFMYFVIAQLFLRG